MQKNTHDSKHVLPALALLAGVGASASVLAQQSVGETILETVVVTVQKRAENLQDVPIAVTALSGEQLEKAGIGNTQALVAVTPGLSIPDNAGFIEPHLRGIG